MTTKKYILPYWPKFNVWKMYYRSNSKSWTSKLGNLYSFTARKRYRYEAATWLRRIATRQTNLLRKDMRH